MTDRRTKRPYTMSDKALAQRRANLPAAAEAATGPRTEEGKAASSRNNWKHGRYSAINRAQFGLGANSVAKLFGRPCLTTCPYHPDNPERTEMPCSLVLDGLTHAGGSCLDKTVYVHALDALMQAMTDGEMDSMHGLMASQMAANMQVLQQIRSEIAERGVMVAVPMTTKAGEPIYDKAGELMLADWKANPILAHLIKFSESLGLNFAEMMATPKARERLKDADDAEGGLQGLLGAIFRRAGSAAGKTLRGGDDD